ncbi:MAG: hypothetical protein M3R01_02735, partial [Actinomycetota bacterium]|nr:hypothetical protein [Actinomycetota bacterium]
MTDLTVERHEAAPAVVGPRPTPRPERRVAPRAGVTGFGSLPAVAALVAVGGLLVWTRVILLGEPLWQDEAYGAWAYVREGPSEILFGTYGIDNHMLYELLTWVITGIAGESEVMYRLAAVVPAVGSALWLSVWAWRRIGPWAGVAFALFVALHPLHLDLARQARGYGLTYLAMAGMIVFGDAYLRKGERRDIALFAGSAAVGVLTFPFFLLTAVFAGAVMLADRRRWRTVLVTFAVTAGIVGALLANAIPQLLRSADDFQNHTRLAPVGWKENVLWPLRQLGPTFAFAVERFPELRVRIWPRTDWETLVTAVVGYPLLAGGLVSLLRRREWRFTALLLVPTVGTYLVVTLRQMGLWERYVSYLLYPTLLLVLLGGRALVVAARRNSQARLALVAGAGLFLYPLLRLVAGPVGGAGLAVALALAAAVAIVPAARIAFSHHHSALGAALVVAMALAAVPSVGQLVDTSLRLDEPPRENSRAVAALITDPDSTTVATTRLDGSTLFYLGLPDYSLVETARWKVGRYGDRVDFVSAAQLPYFLCSAEGDVVFVDNSA